MHLQVRVQGPPVLTEGCLHCCYTSCGGRWRQTCPWQCWPPERPKSEGGEAVRSNDGGGRTLFPLRREKTSGDKCPTPPNTTIFSSFQQGNTALLTLPCQEYSWPYLRCHGLCQSSCSNRGRPQLQIVGGHNFFPGVGASAFLPAGHMQIACSVVRCMLSTGEVVGTFVLCCLHGKW